MPPAAAVAVVEPLLLPLPLQTSLLLVLPDVAPHTVMITTGQLCFLYIYFKMLWRDL